MPTLERKTNGRSKVECRLRLYDFGRLSPITRGTFACSLADNCSPMSREFLRPGKSLHSETEASLRECAYLFLFHCCLGGLFWGS